MIETTRLAVGLVSGGVAAATGVVEPHAWYDDTLFNTLVTLGLGTLIVNWLKTHWRRKDKKRDKTLEFLESTGDRLNHLLSLIFNTLITHNLSEARVAELRGLRRPVFEKRFAVRLGAEAYLNAPEFSRRYDILANQLFDLTEMLPRKAAGAADADLLAEIGRQMAGLEDEWPLAPSTSPSHRHPRVQGDEVLELMQRWGDMIWQRALALISGPLRAEIG